MMVYQIKPGARLNGDAQKIGEKIEEIRLKAGGYLRPEKIVAEARRRSSPLHGCFEWDDSKAAEAHRLDTARYILRVIVVRIESADPPVETRAFVVVDQKDEAQSFTSIEFAMSRPEHREQILARAKAELDQWRKRYQDLNELSAVFEAIDAVSV